MRYATKLVGMTAGLIAGAATFAWAASLNVATGLWEVTSQGETTGIPPIPPAALAHLTPEQRQKVQAAIADAVSHANQPNTTRLCITRKELDQGLRFTTREQHSCKQTALNTSSSTMDAHMECKGDQQATGNLHIVASDRNTISGNFDFVSTDGSNTVTMKRTIQGKWLGSDCGTVKPYEE